MVYQPKVVQMFGIVTDLEKRFICPEAALEYYSGQPVFPRVPRHRLLYENDITPRICVAPTLEDCITAIGVEKFSQCCRYCGDYPVFDCLSNKIYPIIIQEFGLDEPYYKPSANEVSDVAWTREAWICQSATPIDTELVWLHNRSIFADGLEGDEGPLICVDVSFLSGPPQWGVHPWLNNMVGSSAC